VGSKGCVKIGPNELEGSDVEVFKSLYTESVNQAFNLSLAQSINQSINHVA